MGVEYKHGLFVKDLSWRPAWSHVDAVQRVLERWKLVVGVPMTFLLDDDKTEITNEPRGEMPDNLMVVFDGVEGAEVVAVMGPSLYPELADADRYVMSILLCLGVDYRIVQSESLDVEVLHYEGEEPDDDLDPFDSTRYPATWSTRPPNTRSQTAFSGVFRSGLVIDCNKDVPAIADTGGLPSRAFVADLEAAFGTPLVEQGWFV